jgi:hypothetical protein
MRSVQPCLPSPKRRVDSSIIDAKVRALLVRTGEAFGVYPSGELPGGFSPHSRDAQAEMLSLHPTREWSRDDRRGNRLGSVASADGGACCAWPLLVGRKAENGASQDTRASPERGGDRPRARTRTYERPYETSLLEMGRRESSLRNKDKASRECCQARGTKVRIIHHREGQYREVCLVDFSIIVSSLFLVISSPGFADGRPRCLSNLIPVSYILSSLVLV